MEDIGTLDRLQSPLTAIPEGSLDQPILEVVGSEAEVEVGYNGLRTAFEKLFKDNPDRVESPMDDPKVRRIMLRIKGFASASLTDVDGHYVFSVASELDPQGDFRRYTRHSHRAIRRNQIDLFPNNEASHERWIEIWPKTDVVVDDAPQSIWSLGNRRHEPVSFTEKHASRLADILTSNSVKILSATQAVDVE